MPINKCIMPIRVILTYEKQADTGEFIDIPENVINILEKYKKEGKLLNYSKDADDLKKSGSYEITWRDEEAKTEFRSEKPVLQFADDANKHNFENKIYSTLDEFYV